MIVLERNGFVRTGPRDDGFVGFARAYSDPLARQG